MEDTSERVAEKMRKSAMKWHTERHETRIEPVIEKPKKTDEEATKKKTDSLEQELALIQELIQIVEESDLEDGRKAVFLGVLRGAEEKLREGEVHPHMPDIVRNLADKPELRNRVIEATKHYSVDNQSFYYLWGLE